MYKYLNFFNKQGEYCNFSYDETLDKWTGRVDFNTASEGIAEDAQLYILEEVYNTVDSKYELTYPHIDSSLLPGATGSTASSIQVEAYFNPALPVEDIFIYDFSIGATENTLSKLYSLEYDFAFDASQTISGSSDEKPGIKNTSVVSQYPIQLNVAFIPSAENGYSSTLYIKDSSGHVFAEILFYGEGEEEDERLRDLLQSMGCDLLPSDSKIFDSSDVFEEGTNWELINRKRKELLLEYSNIFPYLGSYKALINIIKFFGYQNLRMKEYWLNVDSTTPYYGKYKQINISDVFTEDANFNDSGLIPSKVYKKTNKFGLYYDITVESGEYDINGIPVVEEVFTFTPQEILIKIFALKKKLQNYFLPVNAKIVDIIGEAVYFGRYDINTWNDQYRIDSIELGLKPSFSVLPNRSGYLEDLRPLTFFGCPIGSDLTIGGSSNILSWRVGLSTPIIDVSGVTDSTQVYRFVIEIPTSSTAITLDTTITRDPDTGKDKFEPFEVIDKIITNWRNNEYLNTNFTVYQEGGSSGVMRIVQKEFIGDGTIFVNWYSNTSAYPAATTQYSIPGPTGGTSVSINISTGASGTFGTTGAPMSYYDDCFLGYFDRSNIPITSLNDDEDIPVGYPVVLRNDTFNITWDDANVTFNQVDQMNSSTNKLLYSDYNLSSDSGFPAYFPSQFTYTWTNLGYYGYYEMEWVVSKVADDTSAFYYTQRGTIDELNSLPVILPYVGKYKVELYLWDGYNTKSSLINTDWIEVKIQESDFIAWYDLRELEYNINTKRYDVQSDYATRPINLLPLNDNLSWDEYTSTWELPLHPNEEIGMADMRFNSLDSIEFYQSMVNPSTNPLIDRYPFKFNLLTSLPTWDDLYHLWWDNTGTRVTEWEIDTLSNTTFEIFMTRGNSTINMDLAPITYVTGPTGYTGATATHANGTVIGQSLVSNTNSRVYVWDGTYWKYTNEKIDSYQVTGITGNDRPNFLKIINELNQILPKDGLSHPYLTDFIYYYEEKYDALYNLVPYIKAVSKDFDKQGRHKISYNGAIGGTSSFETVNFGYLGDIPTSFEIYDVESSGPTGSILLPGMDTPYEIGSTNLTDLYSELNGPTAQSYNSLASYQYNLVMGYSGMTGATGSTAGMAPVKIQAISNAFTSPDIVNLTLDGINGTEFGRSLIKNPSWNQVRILKYAQDLPLCTVVNFTYDNSTVHGKKNAIWKLSKEGDLDFDDIYYNNKYFSYMFTQRGSYTLELSIEDTNGNTQTVTKKELIKII